MNKTNQIIKIADIQKRIFTIRGVQVMIDRDLAELYGVETRILNQAAKRNIDRFPERFRFQLTQDEFENLKFQFGTSSTDGSSLKSQIVISNQRKNLKSQIVISSSHGGRRTLPYAFTEQGVAMLSAVPA